MRAAYAFPQAVILPHLYDCRLSDSPDDLFGVNYILGGMHSYANA